MPEGPDPRPDTTLISLGGGPLFLASRLNAAPDHREVPRMLRRTFRDPNLRMTHRTERSLQYARPTRRPAHWEMGLLAGGGLRWHQRSFMAQAVATVPAPDGRIAARWSTDLTAPPAPGGRRIRALVQADIGPAGTDEDPPVAAVIETDRVVVVTFSLRPPVSDDGGPVHYALVLWHPTPASFELSEPLGDRVLLDGHLWPAQPPGYE